VAARNRSECRVAATEGGLCFFHASANKASDLVGTGKRPGPAKVSIHHLLIKWCMILSMSRTNIDIDEGLIRQARKLTRLKTKRQIVERALDLLVRSESRKGILRYYGTGIWKGDLKASRRNRS
jgi:Arc/MetJ family transcription regulator